MLRFEKALDECLQCLKERSLELRPEADLMDGDDVDSISSSIVGGMSSSFRSRVVRFAGNERQMEKLKTRVMNLEKENRTLRQKLTLLEGSQNAEDNTSTEEKKND